MDSEREQQATSVEMRGLVDTVDKLLIALAYVNESATIEYAKTAAADHVAEANKLLLAAFREAALIRYSE